MTQLPVWCLLPILIGCTGQTVLKIKNPIFFVRVAVMMPILGEDLTKI